MNNFDPYYILGINQGCSADTIKKAYRHLARKYHPDKNPLMTEKFMKIQISYEILMGKDSLKEQNTINHNELKESFKKDQDLIYNQKNNINNKVISNQKNNIKLENKQNNTFRENEQNTLRNNLTDLHKKLSKNPTEKSVFEKIEDIPISNEDFGKILSEYMKKRNIKSIKKIFDTKFDLSIFNQVYVDLKKSSSSEIIVKDPTAYNSNDIIKYSYLSNKNVNNNNEYEDTFRNLPKNPNDKKILNKYKSDDAFIRDDILDNYYYSNIKKKINAYNNFI